MQLSADLTQALAWPLAAVILAFALRRYIPQGFGGPFKKLKVGPVEAEWAEQLKEAEKEIGKDVHQNTTLVNQTLPLRLRSYAKDSPRAAILAAFVEVETMLRTLVSNARLQVNGRPATTPQLTRLAVDNHLISGTSGRAINVLRNLQSVAVGPTEISYSEALEFLSLADAIMSSLQERIDEQSQGTDTDHAP